MFEYMTTQAARIEQTQRLAEFEALGAHLPGRSNRWARIVARIRPATPVAPVVALTTRQTATTPGSVAA